MSWKNELGQICYREAVFSPADQKAVITSKIVEEYLRVSDAGEEPETEL